MYLLKCERQIFPGALKFKRSESQLIQKIICYRKTKGPTPDSKQSAKVTGESGK